MIYLQEARIEEAYSVLKTAFGKRDPRAQQYLDYCASLSQKENEKTEEDVKEYTNQLMKEASSRNMESQSPLLSSFLQHKPVEDSSLMSQTDTNDSSSFELEEIQSQVREAEILWQQNREAKEVSKLSLRGNMRKLGELEQKKPSNQGLALRVNQLSRAKQDIYKKLQDKGAVELKELVSLLRDPLFQDKIEFTNTKSGYSFLLMNGSCARVVGTHVKHNKSYKGLDPNFLKRILNALQEVYCLA